MYYGVLFGDCREAFRPKNTIHRVCSTSWGTRGKGGESFRWFRLWRTGDFRVEDSVPRFRYGYDRLDELRLDPVCAALSLCHLESAVTERMVRRYDNTIACPRIRIKENSNRTKYMILYLLEDRAVSADFRFRFVFDPSIHADEKRRQDAADLWQKMQQLARGNCAGN